MFSIYIQYYGIATVTKEYPYPEELPTYYTSHKMTAHSGIYTNRVKTGGQIPSLCKLVKLHSSQTYADLQHLMLQLKMFKERLDSYFQSTTGVPSTVQEKIS